MEQNQVVDATAWPQYKSHKIVNALKITSIEQTPEGIPSEFVGGSYDVTPETPVGSEPSFATFQVPADFVTTHGPEVGGYIVSYDDGYLSYSPVEPFENGYSPVGIAPLPTGEATNDSQDPAVDVREELQAKHAELQTAAKSLLARFETYFAEIPAHFHQEIAALKAKL